MNPARFDTWFWMGRTQYWGRISGEFVITWRWPWRRKIYCISTDEMRVGHPRVAFRLRWGTSLDQFTQSRLVECSPPESFRGST